MKPVERVPRSKRRCCGRIAASDKGLNDNREKDMAYRRGMAGVAAMLALASCGSPKDASKGNFQTALQSWFDANPECITINQMPAEVRADAAPKDRAGYEALTTAGLLSVERRRIERPKIMGTDMSYDALIYRPTKTGEQVIRKSANRLTGGYELCFARRAVVEFTSYTEPADVMGLRASQVRYRYRLEDVAPWAQTATVRSAIPRLATALDAPEGEDKASLILTSEGWQHESSLRK